MSHLPDEQTLGPVSEEQDKPPQLLDVTLVPPTNPPTPPNPSTGTLDPFVTRDPVAPNTIRPTVIESRPTDVESSGPSAPASSGATLSLSPSGPVTQDVVSRTEKDKPSFPTRDVVSRTEKDKASLPKQPARADRPRSVDEYDIVSELGRGGMGVVYKAVHRQLKRTVALKMILAGSYAGREQLARFRLEAEAIARIQHPHIIQIFEIGETEGNPYFALEYVDGGSLDRYRGTPQPIEPAAGLIEALARAMHVAHQADVVHRDLKPGNVLLAASRVQRPQHRESRKNRRSRCSIRRLPTSAWPNSSTRNTS